MEDNNKKTNPPAAAGSAADAGAKKKKKKTGFFILAGVVAVLLGLVVAAGAVITPVLRAYRNSLDEISIITRPDEYTVPDGPDEGLVTVDPTDWTYDPDDPWGEDYTGTFFDPDATSAPVPVDPGKATETEPATPPTDPVTETAGVPVDTHSPSSAVDPVTSKAPPVTTKAPPATTKAPAETTKKPAVTTKPEPTAPQTTGEPHEVASTGIYYVKQKDPNIENILLIGLDTRDANSFSGRSDCMIVMSYNKSTGEVKLVSLLRDILVPISGHGYNRLNAAYAFGGAALCINTINDYFGLDIQKYAAINFSGVINLIDKCGGVDIKLTPEEYAELGTGVVSNGNGTFHLNGAQAKNYMSLRHMDNGDFTRTDRQRNVLTSLYSQLIAKKSVSEILDIVTYGFAYVRTNIPLSYIISVARSVLSYGSGLKITSDRIPCTGSWNYGYYYGKAIISINRQKNISYLSKLIWNR